MKYLLGVFLILFAVVAFSGSNQGIGTGSSTGGLSNAELRASPIAVSGSFAVTGSLTNTELRAAPLNVISSNIDVALSTRLKPSDTLAAVTTVGTITNPVAITTSSPLSVISSNLDVALSTRLKPSDTLAAVTTVGTITNPVAITTSSPLSVVSSNLDVALSTRLKAADTLAGITTVGAVTSITNPVAITTSSPLSVVSSNLDVALSTRLKAADTLAGVTTVGTITNPVAITTSSPLSVVSSNLDSPLSGLLKPSSTLNAVTTVGTITNSVTTTNTNLDVALSTRLKPADTLTGITTVGAVTSITNPVAITASAPLSVQSTVGLKIMPVDSASGDLTSVKSTQTSRFIGVQEPKDASRTHVRYYAVGVAAGATGVETLISLNKSSGTSATSSSNTFVITSGKKYRINKITFGTRGHATATVQSTTFNLRINTAGACIVSSTPILLAARSGTPATSSAMDRVDIPYSEGYEIAGDGTLQMCLTAASGYVTNAPTWDVLIDGYEY